MYIPVDVRDVIYTLSGGASRIDKPMKLDRNFRSHSGILKVTQLTMNTYAYACIYICVCTYVYACTRMSMRI